VNNQSPCAELQTQVHPHRVDTTLVDLTGDGLLTAALPTEHVKTTLELAGYKQVNLRPTAIWCLPQPLLSKLLQPGRANVALAPQYKLVKGSAQKWQLLAGEQAKPASLEGRPVALRKQRTGAGKSVAANARPNKASQQNLEPNAKGLGDAGLAAKQPG
jgi:hypothetical protein